MYYVVAILTLGGKNPRIRDWLGLPFVGYLRLNKNLWTRFSTWLVVEPTHLKKYAHQIGFIFPNFRGENKAYLRNHHLGTHVACVCLKNNTVTVMDLIPRTARDAPPKPRWHSSLNIIDNKNEPCTRQETNSWHYKNCWCLYCRCFSFLSKGV